MQATFLATVNLPDGVSREAIAEEIQDILLDNDIQSLSVRPWATQNQDTLAPPPLLPSDDPNQGFLPFK